MCIPENSSARVSLQAHNHGLISNGFGQSPPDEAKQLNFDLANATASISMNTLDGKIEIAPGAPEQAAQTQDTFDWSSVDTSILDFAYMDSDYSILDFDSIYIKTPVVEFDPRWLKEYGNETTQSYRDRIVKEYSDILERKIEDIFTKKTDLTVVKTRVDDVLVLFPKVVNLFIATPDRDGIGDIITTTPAGNAEIDLVVFSSEHQAILGLFMDKRSTGKSLSVGPSKRRTINTREFEQLFDHWLKDIIKVIKK